VEAWPEGSAAEPRLKIPSVSEWISPIPAIIAAQLFTYHLAVAKGFDPEEARGLSRVTRTT
jgi:glucosamine 6-phosphate synthetase-like amidotransferase/phosphosugar isomerase protein